MQERAQRAREAQARLQELAANRVAVQQRAEAQEKAKVTAATTKFEREKELATLKADLKKKDIDPLDKRKKELDIQKLEQELAGERGLSATQQLAMDEREKDELAATAEMFVDSKGREVEVPFEERAINAQQANNRVGNKVYYRVIPPVETGWLDLERDQPGDVQPVFLPKDKTTGKQITSQDIEETARKYGLTPEQVLIHIGALAPEE